MLPKLPDDAVSAVVDHLTSEELLAHISFHIGTKDLVLSEVVTSHELFLLNRSKRSVLLIVFRIRAALSRHISNDFKAIFMY